MLAEKAGQALQTELLRLNEYSGNAQVTHRQYTGVICYVSAELLEVICCLFFNVFTQSSHLTSHSHSIGGLTPLPQV